MEGADIDSWRKSSFSNGGENCIEVADSTGIVLIRDTKQEHHTDRTTLAVTSDVWATFINNIK